MFDDAGSELTSKLLDDPVSIDIDDLFADAVGVRACARDGLVLLPSSASPGCCLPLVSLLIRPDVGAGN
jgi:hypothetical protein